MIESKNVNASYRMAYKSMKNSYYYGGTFLIYLVAVIGASTIKDLGSIFSFGAAISGSTL